MGSLKEYSRTTTEYNAKKPTWVLSDFYHIFLPDSCGPVFRDAFTVGLGFRVWAPDSELSPMLRIISNLGPCFNSKPCVVEDEIWACSRFVCNVYM